MDCGQIISVLVGAAIGLLSSVCILVIERILDRHGKLSIYYKVTTQKGIGKSWGFYENNDGTIYFTVPVIYEIQNTSNTTRVVRDVGLYTFNNSIKVKKLVQADYFHITQKTGNVIKGEQDIYFGAEKGSYSFVVEPRSIKRFECEYMLKINKNEIGKNHFNKIVLQYYDEKNRVKKFDFKPVSEAWSAKKYEPDEDWILLRKIKK